MLRCEKFFNHFHFRYFVSPLMILGLCIFGWIHHTPLKYGDIPYPPWAHGLGWIIASISLACIPIFAINAGMCCLDNVYNGKVLLMLHLT